MVDSRKRNVMFRGDPHLQDDWFGKDGVNVFLLLQLIMYRARLTNYTF